MNDTDSFAKLEDYFYLIEAFLLDVSLSKKCIYFLINYHAISSLYLFSAKRIL